MLKKRILLKLSGEFFKSTDNAVEIGHIFALAKEIGTIAKKYQLAVVFGGGNIFRGRQMAGQKITRPADWHFVGMAATLVNAMALKAVFDQLEIPAVTVSALTDERPDLEKYFSQGKIIIFACGTGRPFVTTDSAAIERALEIKADMVLKGTKVDGVYSADPNKNPRAKKFTQLSATDYLKIKNANIFDQKAVTLAAKKKLPIYIFKWSRGVLKKAVKLNADGTLINSQFPIH